MLPLHLLFFKLTLGRRLLLDFFINYIIFYANKTIFFFFKFWKVNSRRKELHITKKNYIWRVIFFNYYICFGDWSINGYVFDEWSIMNIKFVYRFSSISFKKNNILYYYVSDSFLFWKKKYICMYLRVLYIMLKHVVFWENFKRFMSHIIWFYSPLCVYISTCFKNFLRNNWLELV